MPPGIMGVKFARDGWMAGRTKARWGVWCAWLWKAWEEGPVGAEMEGVRAGVDVDVPRPQSSVEMWLDAWEALLGVACVDCGCGASICQVLWATVCCVPTLALGPVGIAPGVMTGLALGRVLAAGADARGADGVAGAAPQASLDGGIGRGALKDGRPPRPAYPPPLGPAGMLRGPVGRDAAAGAVGTDGAVGT